MSGFASSHPSSGKGAALVAVLRQPGNGAALELLRDIPRGAELGDIPDRVMQMCPAVEDIFDPGESGLGIGIAFAEAWVILNDAGA